MVESEAPSPEVDIVPPSDELSQLQQQDASLFGLLRVLLSPKTLPHILMLATCVAVLYIIAKSGSTTTSALGFLSLSSGYLITGLLTNLAPVQRWTQLPQEKKDGQNTMKRLIFSFRICIFPFVMSLISLSILLALIGSNGVLGDHTGLLALILSSCFVVWAVVQGRGVALWLAAVASTRLPSAMPRQKTSTTASTLLTFIVLLAISFGLLLGFEWIAGAYEGPASVVMNNLIFIAAWCLIFFLSWKFTELPRTLASSSTELHSFSVRWMFMSQLLISWHLLTVWRHIAISPSQTMLMGEELGLMIFTVIMAIWGLTSRSFRSSVKLVTATNALPIGLAFGYAYAGSVAMLTVVFEDVQHVMMAGHIIVALTFFWLQARMLKQVVKKHDNEAAQHRITNEASILGLASATLMENASLSQPRKTEEPEMGDETLKNANPVQANQAVQEKQEHISHSIGDEVAWAAPQVLADVAHWDDDIELVDEDY